MKNELISIIIPCYNSEKFIRKCLDSIISQTYKNIEVFAIDDCSTDNTFSILKEYSNKYNYINVYKNEKNSGAGYSRNYLLKKINGKYVSFIDSDDYLDENFYNELYNSITLANSDVAVCDILVKYYNKNDVRNKAVLGNYEKINFINNGLAASPCNKLFKIDLIKNIKFAEGIMNEDVPFVLTALITANKIAYTDKTVYNYVQNKDSVQNQSLSIKRLDIFKAINILKNNIINIDNCEDYLEAIVYNQIICFLLYVIPTDSDKNNRKKLMKESYKYVKNIDLNNNKFFKEFLNNQSKKYKIYYKYYIYFFTKKKFNIVNMFIDYQYYRNKKIHYKVIDDICYNDLIICAKKQSSFCDNPVKVSVVIPNYNYEKFLVQRLYSILNQNVKIGEIIILDDCSTDNSRNLIDQIVADLEKYIDIKKVYNTKNSGSAFKQWKKGFELAKYDYVWIAEADDYCDKNFLKTVSKPITKDKNIVISYCDTAFIDGDGFLLMRSIVYEIDILKSKHWNRNYINSGMDEFNNYSYLNCTIANVSSVLFRKDDYSKQFELSGEYKQAGDWLFYVNVMIKGDIAYNKKTLNFYRLHGNNVTSVTKKQSHFNEIKNIHKYFDKTYKLNPKQKKNISYRYDFLERVWDLDKK